LDGPALPLFCAHARTEIRQRVLSGGSTAVVRQCLECGAQVGPAIPKAAAQQPLPPFDPDITATYERTRRGRILDRRIAEDDERRARYEQYMRSPEWQARRAKVLERDRYQCQACRERRANDVHHLHYRNFGREPLFDLVAICRPCHDALHGGDDGQA